MQLHLEISLFRSRNLLRKSRKRSRDEHAATVENTKTNAFVRYRKEYFFLSLFLSLFFVFLLQ